MQRWGVPLIVAAAALWAGLSPAIADPAGTPAVAEPEPRIAIELNKIEPQDKACRTYFVIRNGADQAVSDLRLDIFIFDDAGVIVRRFAMSTGRLRPGKTVVRLFDVPDLDCGEAARFLVSEVLSCETEGDAASCADRITVSGRGAVELEF